MNKATVEFNRQTCYVVTDEENRLLGVLTSEQGTVEIKFHNEDITKRIELMIKENECAKSATLAESFEINSGYMPHDFSCDTITDDDQKESRIYTIVPTVLY